MSSPGRVLIYGGRGALGAVIVKLFKEKNWFVCSVDMVANDQADCNVVVKETVDWCKQSEEVCAAVAKCAGEHKFNAVLCVAGGFAMAPLAADDFVSTCDRMWKQSVWPSVVSAQIAVKHLCPDGLLQLTGAVPALKGTPALMGYGMSKAAVHQFVHSLAGKGAGLPADACTLAILPVTLDTPANRSAMPKADFGSWTPLEFVAGLLFDWASKQGESRPKSGSLVKLVTKDGKTEQQIV